MLVESLGIRHQGAPLIELLFPEYGFEVLLENRDGPAGFREREGGFKFGCVPERSVSPWSAACIRVQRCRSLARSTVPRIRGRASGLSASSKCLAALLYGGIAWTALDQASGAVSSGESHLRPRLRQANGRLGAPMRELWQDLWKARVGESALNERWSRDHSGGETAPHERFWEGRGALRSGHTTPR